MKASDIKILLLEDHKELGESLCEKFSDSGYSVFWAKTLKEAKTYSKIKEIDLFVLDVGLPDGTGFDFASWLKENEYNQAFIFLTAMGDAEDRLRGYELGAEEYIPKPFLYKELELRINHVLDNHSQLDIYKLPDLEINFSSMTLNWKDGEIVFPQTRDLQILKFMILSSPKVISRDQILDEIWGKEDFPTERTVDNSIVRLRQILKDYNIYLRSVRGVGYQWLVSETL